MVADLGLQAGPARARLEAAGGDFAHIRRQNFTRMRAAHGLREAFSFAIAACLVAAAASLMRGGQYHDGDAAETGGPELLDA